jgi:hypothetical protein
MTKYCTACGAPLDASWRYCPHCGAIISPGTPDPVAWPEDPNAKTLVITAPRITPPWGDANIGGTAPHYGGSAFYDPTYDPRRPLVFPLIIGTANPEVKP